MANIVFSTSKNGQKTCSANGTYLHSSYDPQKEANRFVESIKHDFIPQAIVITEPALSYCAAELRKKFSTIPLIAIRYDTSFKDTDFLWDLCIHYTQCNQLLNQLGEEILLSTIFLSWQPSQNAFVQEHKQTWSKIKSMLKTAQDILATRKFFARRWIKNVIKFCILTENTAQITKGDSPILIAASGPSLKTSLPIIKKNRKSFFLIALSSAYSTLISEEIVPDLCISTDGGYWAKRHIANCKIPLALSPESAASAQLLNRLQIIPLIYADAPESYLLNLCGFDSQQAKRNGTVSGTAAELALSITSGPVFACGLDLENNSKGFQHTQPNILELDKSINDYRLFPKEQRVFPSQLKNESLQVYQNWFSTRDSSFASRFFRLATNNYKFNNNLGNIASINWDDFSYITKNSCKSTIFPTIKTNQNKLPSRQERLSRIKDTLENLKKNLPEDLWISSLLPTDYLLYKRTNDFSKIEKNFALEIDFLGNFVKSLEQAI